MREVVINESFLERLERLELLLKNNVAGAFGGNRQSKSFGSSSDFADRREYRAGDDITKIDWNVYARTEQLYQKLYLDERQMHTKIYIDASRSMDYGGGEKAQMAVKLAASLAYLSIAGMEKVSVYALYGGDAVPIVSSVVGKDNFLSVIGKLNSIEFSADCRISEAILKEKLGYGDGMSVLISDFLTDDDFERAVDCFVQSRRDLLCIQVLSPSEITPSLSGRIHLYDSEDAERTYRKNVNREILAAYREAVAYATDRIKNYLTARGADYMLVSSDEDISDVLFGKMERLGVLK